MFELICNPGGVSNNRKVLMLGCLRCNRSAGGACGESQRSAVVNELGCCTG